MKSVLLVLLFSIFSVSALASNAWKVEGSSHPLWTALKVKEIKSTRAFGNIRIKTAGPVLCKLSVIKKGKKGNFKSTVCTLNEKLNTPAGAVELHKVLKATEYDSITVVFKKVGKLIVQRDQYQGEKGKYNKAYFSEECFETKTFEQQKSCLKYWSEELMESYNADNSYYMAYGSKKVKAGMFDVIKWGVKYPDKAAEAIEKIKSVPFIGLIMVWGDELNFHYAYFGDNLNFPQLLHFKNVVDISYSTELQKLFKLNQKSNWPSLTEHVVSSYLLGLEKVFPKDPGIRSAKVWLEDEIEMMTDDY